ncbi:MAG: hypothetical protein [Caudoviricetes sp.]|nr:MAG: hypothetical protein [Caudoviricetes sp.]
MATIERTVYTSLTQEANSTIVLVPGTVGIKSGTISVFFPDVRKGRVEYKITDHTGKVTTLAPDAPWETPEGIKVVLISEGITAGRQLAEVTTTGAVGLMSISVVLLDWPTDKSRLEALEAVAGDHESRIVALEAKP